MIEGLAARIRCPTCGTDQEVHSAGGSMSCVICASPLGAVSPPASRNGPSEKATASDEPASSPATFELTDVSLFARATAALPSEAEVSAMQPLEIDELLEAEKRAVSSFALVPFWGAWRISQSDLHPFGEKLRLVTLSVLLTLSLIAAAWLALPGAKERSRAEQAQIDSRLEALAQLVRSYRRQYGTYPDEETWQRSAHRGDLRFFDPWGRVYVYRKTNQGFVIGTYGRDGLPGGPNEEQDFFRTFRDAEEIVPRP